MKQKQGNRRKRERKNKRRNINKETREKKVEIIRGNEAETGKKKV